MYNMVQILGIYIYVYDVHVYWYVLGACKHICISTCICMQMSAKICIYGYVCT